jgi:hypothetical protein
MICVHINKKFLYLPFQWNENKGLTVLYKKEWQKVVNTFEKNKYNEFVFELVKE